MKKLLTGLCALVFITSTSITAHAEIANKLSPTGRIAYALQTCQTETQLDCLDSVSVVTQEGAKPAEFKGVEDENEEFKDQWGNTRQRARTVWSAGNSEFKILTWLQTKDTILGKWGKNTHTGSELFVIVDGPADDVMTKLRIKVRTSWIKPLNVTMHAWEPAFDEAKIPGGRMWTFEGIQTPTSWYNDNWEQKQKAGAKADGQGVMLDFHVHHAGKSGEDSFFDPRCSKYGYTVESSNAGSGGVPDWNPQTRSLDFAIQAPHKNLDGKLNKGFFKLWATKTYMKCMWPSSGLANAKNFSISVYNEDGSKQVATTVVNYKGGVLKVAALNFHYSSPTIRLKAKK